MSNTVTEEMLEEAYQLIEKGVWMIADANDEIMSSQKSAIVEEFFNMLVSKCNIQSVD